MIISICPAPISMVCSATASRASASKKRGLWLLRCSSSRRPPAASNSYARSGSLTAWTAWNSSTRSTNSPCVPKKAFILGTDSMSHAARCAWMSAGRWFARSWIKFLPHARTGSAFSAGSTFQIVGLALPGRPWTRPWSKSGLSRPISWARRPIHEFGSSTFSPRKRSTPGS